MSTSVGDLPEPFLEKNLWLKILDEVSSASNSSSRIDGCTMLIVGNRSFGKTQLLSSISPHMPIPSKQGAGLQYIPLDIYDKNEENHDSYGILNCYILDGDLAFENLIQFAIHPEDILQEKFLLVICIDMSKPWFCLESLKKWFDVVNRYIDQLNLAPNDVYALKEKFYKRFILKGEMSSHDKTLTGDCVNNQDYNRYPIFPVVVVGTKTDNFNYLELNHKINGDIQDLIQVHLRKYCLSNGAALIFTSSRNEANNEFLYRYITKLLYNFKYEEIVNITDRESLFIPLGWDSTKKIELLKETITSVCPDFSLDTYLNVPFAKGKISKSPLKVIMDDDLFYETLEKNLSKDPLISNNASSLSNQHLVANRAELLEKLDSTTSQLYTVSNTSNLSTAVGDTITNPRVSEKTTGELADFFSTLLTSKMTSSPSSHKK